MREWWTSLSKDVWSVAVLLVALMSGIAAIFREFFSVFYPRAADPSRLFTACLLTCLVFSFTFVAVRQRSAIVDLERNARESRETDAERTRRHELFAGLMGEGEELSRSLLHITSNYGSWLEKRREWVGRVSQALIDIGLPTEAAAFRHATESSPNIGGVMNNAYWQRFYGDQLQGGRGALQEIVQRRLP